MKKIYFLSSNKYKIEEVCSILNKVDVEIVSVEEKVEEIQSDNMEDISRDKVLKAFTKIGRAVLVEQTGLILPDFGNLPGGLTQIFWDSLQADKFCELFSSDGKSTAVARTVLAYCDGRHVYTFDGEIEGTIVNPPRGNRDFQWDCVFQPIGYDKTFAELKNDKATKDVKNEISMRKIALEKFRTFLEGDICTMN